MNSECSKFSELAMNQRLDTAYCYQRKVRFTSKCYSALAGLHL